MTAGRRASCSRRASVARAAALLLAAAVAWAAAGCGALGPQVRPADANRVAGALSEIAAACGEAYQETGGRRPLPGAAVRAAAAERAVELAHAYAHGPDRIYQGQTLRETVARTVAYLRECRLPAVAAALERQTSVKA
jgi:hypothetical protein